MSTPLVTEQSVHGAAGRGGESPAPGSSRSEREGKEDSDRRLGPILFT
jgi:hypothetical protein